MFAASGYETLKLMKTPAFAHENWTEFWIGFVVSAVVAFIAVKWLLRYVRSHRFTIFAWYRIVFGTALFLWLPSCSAGGNPVVPDLRPPHEQDQHHARTTVVAATRVHGGADTG